MRKNKDKPEEVAMKKKGRLFEVTQCTNANCKYTPNYKPKRKNQRYCCEQCQIDAANDRAQEKNKTKYKDEKLLRLYDKKLQRLYSFFLKDGLAQVHVSFLRYENVDLTKSVHQQINSNSNQPIRWFYDYGTERNADNNDWFFIHKKIKP